MGPLGAVLLVGEGWGVANLLEDLAEGLAVAKGGFSLNADFVARWFSGVFWTIHPFVGDGPSVTVFADPENLTFGAELAGGRVVEGVVFEGSGGVEMEAELREA